jgi:outer membrane protein assembly factor BamB
MVKQAAAAVSFLLAMACALVQPRPAPPLEGNPFPAEVAGSLELPGRAGFALAGPGNKVFLILDGGDLLCLDAAGKSVLWTYRTGSPVELAPGLGASHVYLCDRENVLHAVGFDGAVVFRRTIGEEITSSPVESGGRVYLGTGGSLRALDAENGGEPLWDCPVGAAVRSAPVFSGDRIFFGDESGTLRRLDLNGTALWSFEARGRILVSPAASNKRVFFGTEERFFYCLDAARGRKKWSFKLDGGPVESPLVQGKRVVFPATNSVVYCLSGRRGEILWWTPIPSRLPYPPVISGEVALVSSASSEIKALDLETGRDVGRVNVSGEVSAGVLWKPPFLVVVARDPVRAVDRVLFLERTSAAGLETFPPKRR